METRMIEIKSAVENGFPVLWSEGGRAKELAMGRVFCDRTGGPLSPVKQSAGTGYGVRRFDLFPVGPGVHTVTFWREKGEETATVTEWTGAEFLAPRSEKDTPAALLYGVVVNEFARGKWANDLGRFRAAANAAYGLAKHGKASFFKTLSHASAPDLFPGWPAPDEIEKMCSPAWFARRSERAEKRTLRRESKSQVDLGKLGELLSAELDSRLAELIPVEQLG